MVAPAQLLAVGGDHPPDPDVAAVSAGMSTFWITLIGPSAALALAIAWVVRRSRARPEESGVA